MQVNAWEARKREVVVMLAIWLAAYAVFRCAPIRQLHDSKYTMLLAENIIRHHDRDLSRYGLPSDDYRLVTVGARRTYWFPAGSAILSVPFVALMRLRGASAVRPDGAYDLAGELAMDARLAAALMAAFAVVVYATARALLPVPHSLGLTAAVALGTQVFSTASRSVWSDTWGILLVGAAILVLVRSAARGARPNGALVAVLLTVSYAVRPTNAMAVVAVGVYLFRSDVRAFARFAGAAALIAALFVFDSWTQFHAVLPPYFAARRLTFPTPLVAVAGNLVSPSRGLLVFVPSLFVVGAALVSFRGARRHGGLLKIALLVVVAHFVVLAGYWDWWGGHSYGPRLTTSLVPWFALLGVLAVDAGRSAADRAHPPRRKAFLLATALLGGLSIAMNAVGACSPAADRWNVQPDNINADTARLWDWRHPQFLAPLTAAKP